jgi:hypothetical protein
MAFTHGKVTTFSLDNPAGSLVNISAYCDSVDFPQTVETAETTAFGASVKSYIIGLTDATISLSGKWDAALEAVMNGTHILRTFSYSPDGGSTTYGGEAILTSYSTSNPVGDVVTWSADLQITGAIT